MRKMRRRHKKSNHREPAETGDPCVCVCVGCMPWCEGYYMDLLANCCLMLLMLLKSLVQADRRRVAYCRINHKKGFSAGGTWGKDGAGANEDTHPIILTCDIGAGRHSYVPAYVYEVARSCYSVNHRLRLRRQWFREPSIEIAK